MGIQFNGAVDTNYEDGPGSVGVDAYRVNLAVLGDLIESDLSRGEEAARTLGSSELLKVRALVDENSFSTAVSPRAKWRRLNEGELRLFAIMSEPRLTAEMPSQFVRAEQLGVAGREAMKAAYDLPASTFEDRRAIAVALLQRMYVRYGDRRVNRTERKVVDERMLNFAVWVFAGLAVLTMFLSIAQRLNPECVAKGAPDAKFPCDFPYLWLVVWYFGVIGAFFSRFLEYRKNRIDLSWEDLTSGYSVWVTSGRLMIGGIGALFFYFLMRGDLLAGQLFLEEGDLGVWDGKGNLVGSEAMFRLFVWSAIAGFSERLVPERFDELASGARAREET